MKRKIDREKLEAKKFRDNSFLYDSPCKHSILELLAFFGSFCPWMKYLEHKHGRGDNHDCWWQ